MRRKPRQGGVALVTAMVLMLAVMMVGFSAVTAALMDAKSARQERDRQVALRAAEAALLDAEHDVLATPVSSPRFAALAGAGFIAGCGKEGGANHGLCAVVAPPSWQVIDLASDDAALVSYGTFSLRSLGGVAQPPRYLIELLPLDAAYGRFYRITAIGFGQRASTRVVLQSFYRMAPPAGAGPPVLPAAPAAADPSGGVPVPAPGETGEAGETAAVPAPASSGDAASAAVPAVPVSPAVPAPFTALPTRRLGWREVANWPALHAAALH